MSLAKQPRVVITGAGSGLGRAFCEQLARRQARVLLSDIDLPSAQATAERIAGTAGAVHVQRCDVSRLEEIEALGEAADRLLGGVDLIINNAGVGTGGPVGEVPIADWHWLMDINLWGPIYGCHVFVPRLRRQGAGHVINVASAAGLLSAPRMGPYNVAKAGVVALSETLRAELQGTGIGVTVLCPTFFQTNIARASRGGSEQERATAQAMMDRARITANQVAEAALRGAERDRLYVIPQADGRVMWRIKRLAPQFFQDSASRVIGRVVRRMGGGGQAGKAGPA